MPQRGSFRWRKRIQAPKPGVTNSEDDMAHKFVIEQNKAGEYVAKFKYNSEIIFWTEGYSSKASARNAIASVIKNGPTADIEEA
jgi:uncharacterized protein YegP (UPF0339 family)